MKRQHFKQRQDVFYYIFGRVINIHGNMTDVDIPYWKLYETFQTPLVRTHSFISSHGRVDVHVHVFTASPWRASHGCSDAQTHDHHGFRS